MPTPVTVGREALMRHLRALVLVVVLVAGSLALASPATAGGTGAVAGTVTGDGGVGVAGVSVLVYAYEGYPTTLARTVTDANGAYLLPRVPAGHNLAVCFDAAAAVAAPPEGYRSGCGTARAWGGPDEQPAVYAEKVTPDRTTRIAPTLLHGGGVTGRVTATDGAGLGGVEVWAGGSTLVMHTTTAADGTYHLRGVMPSSGVRVCFYAPPTTTGSSSTTGYLGQCYDGVFWQGGSGPRMSPSLDATPLEVLADAPTTGIDAVLGPAGVVTGTVRAEVGGAPVAGVLVGLVSGSSNVGSALTNARGVYRIGGVRTGDRYLLCVDASSVAGRPDRTYLSECWHDRAWDPVHEHTPWASDSDRFTVTEGAVSRLDVGLAQLGHLAGDVTTAAGAPLAGVGVVVYRGAQYYEGAGTDAAGHYVVDGLPADPVGYTVCFLPSDVLNASRPGGYRPECHDGQLLVDRFQPVPTTTTPVPVTAGGTTTVDAQLVPGTEFAGTVTTPADVSHQGLTVLVFDDRGAVVTTRLTDAAGHYDVVGLPPRGGYRVCVQGVHLFAFPVGIASQCNGRTWSGALAAPTGSPLPATAGHATRVDLTLRPGGAISGLTGVRGEKFELVVIDAAGEQVGTALRLGVSIAQMPYRVVGLTPSAGPYRVCFRTVPDTTLPRTGITPFCWNGPGVSPVTWDGAVADVPDAATVAVTAGGEVTGIDGGPLTPGAAIEGTVRAAGQPAAGVTVTVFAPTGAVVRSVTTSATGTYSASGLNATTGPYRVCSTAPAGYRPRCWQGVPWSGSGGPPAGAVGIGVTAGTVTPAITFNLPAG